MNSWKRRLTTLFIAFHLLAIALWVLPFRPPLPQRWIGPYFSLMGLSQDWSLFAPDPISANSFVDAQVVLQSGEVRTWSFPRLDVLDLPQRYSKARYRKYTGWLYREQFAYAWPDAARYVARQFKDSAAPARSVSLARHWARTLPINAGHYVQPVWHTQIFFTYPVEPGDLQ